jgi:hypothetical protein
LWRDLSATVSGAPASALDSPSATFEGSGLVVYARVPGGLGQFRLNGSTWTDAGYGGPAIEGSPVATSTEVLVLAPSTQSLWKFSTTRSPGTTSFSISTADTRHDAVMDTPSRADDG